MFQDPPGCWLHRQASFITAFFPEDAGRARTTTGSRSRPIDQEGTLYAGELAVVGSGTARGRRLPRAVHGRRRAVRDGRGRASSRISPNVNVGPDCYANQILADPSEVLTEALATEDGRVRRLRPDASRRSGSGSFWTGMVGVHAGGAGLPGPRSSTRSRGAGRPEPTRLARPGSGPRPPLRFTHRGRGRDAVSDRRSDGSRADEPPPAPEAECADSRGRALAVLRCGSSPRWRYRSRVRPPVVVLRLPP